MNSELTFHGPYGTTLSVTNAHTKPFAGVLFHRQKIDDISLCVCPPYDVITDSKPYYDRSPFNAIRMELPTAHPPMDAYATARQTMDRWFDESVLTRDGRETIYVYEQEFQIDRVVYLRRGFIALHELDRERILTHEETRKKAKEDRERLISTLKTFTSLIFGLYEDREEDIERILVSSQREKIYDFVDEQTITNRFYRMTSSDEIGALTRLMDQRKIYVADGHHRLDVSYRLNLSHVPLYLTNMYARAVMILPYHRIITFEQPKALNAMLESVKGWMDVEKRPFTDDKGTHRILGEIAASSRPAYVLYSKDDKSNFYVLSAKQLPPYPDEGIHESLKTLKVNILHAAVLKNLLHVKDEEISFTQDPYEPMRLIREGALDLAVFLPPTTVEEVKNIADNGLYMPPKSTFFYPKILTGLVFHKYA
jgi:uncharacterized protein (DUF1015 family)